MRRAQTGSTRRASQAGVGMVLMMGLGMLVIAMAFVAHRIFDGAVSSSTSHVTYEQALHLAETGIDQTLARLQKNEAYSMPCRCDSVMMTDANSMSSGAQKSKTSRP